MSNKIEVGKTYRLVDASKDIQLHNALRDNIITLPADGIFTVNELGKGSYDGQLVGYSLTAGAQGYYTGELGGSLVIQQNSLDLGAFELVE